MDTTHHREISKVGEKVLREALNRVGRKDLRTTAFYLGNWLTDVQQAVDPVPYAAVVESLAEVDRKIGKWFDELQSHAPMFFLGRVLKGPLADLRGNLDRARGELQERVHSLFENGGDLAKGLKHAFKYLGYFKFVYAQDGKSEVRMDRACYEKVYDERFRQYFPHEHLDRPEVGKDRYDTQAAKGPQNEWARRDRSRDLYHYLREDLRVAAGLLGLLDGGPAAMPAGGFGWAAATFHPSRARFVGQDGRPHDVSDKDYEWNRHLALLGHAMHGVEDYFAHSTFVEHAILALPAKVSRFQRKEDALLPQVHELARRILEWQPNPADEYVLGFLDQGDVLARRLKAWQADIKDWKTLPDDRHVCTGYFDFQDTLISVSHAIEELWGVERTSAGRKIDELAEYEYAKLLTDTLEFCADPRKVWTSNSPGQPDYSESTANVAVKWLRDKGGKGLKLIEGRELEEAIQFMVQDGPLKDKPRAVQDEFAQAVRVLGKGLGGALIGYNLYTLAKELRLLVANPLAWLGKTLSEKAMKLLKQYGLVYVRRGVASLVGAYRIGCHSLIAKDSGPELLQPEAMKCAKAVHWYVLSTLTRHSWPAELAVSRGSPGGAPNLLSRYQWLDWLELVEHFCDYPLTAAAAGKTREIATTIQHVTRPGPGGMSSDSLLKLAKEYEPGFVPRPKEDKRELWEVIADANFPTLGMVRDQRIAQINKLLAATGQGKLVSDKINYAFKPGLKVNIPYQKAQVPDFSSEKIEERWWFQVMAGDYNAIYPWLVDGRPGPLAPKGSHRWIAIDRSRHDKLVRGAFGTRSSLEEAYNAKAQKPAAARK
jgi:hypothetical protein